MSKHNRFEIMKRLANDHTLEMNQDELEQLLNAELDKPADEIDAALVEEILMAMDVPAPDPKRKQADWPIVRKYLPKRQASQRMPSHLLRTCAAAAVVIAVLLIPFREAGAFRWTLIQKIFRPVAQTFGIVIDTQTTAAPEQTPSPQYAVSDAPSSLTVYAAIEDVPLTHGDYMIRPDWLPEGFRFASGSRFTSLDTELFSLDFVKDDRLFTLYIHIFLHDEETGVSSLEFEQTLDEPLQVSVGTMTVSFYNNAHDRIQSASWVNEKAHYQLSGDITPDDILCFVQHME